MMKNGRKMMNLISPRHLLKLIAFLCVLLMVMGAYLAAHASASMPFAEMYGFAEEGLTDDLARYGRIGGMLSAAASIVFSWLSSKLEKPWRMLAIGVGIGCAFVLGIMGMAALSLRKLSQEAMKQAMGSMLAASLLRYVLILAMLLAIVWLVSNMIRRHLTERK